MKKLLILLALVVALGTSSCVFMFDYEITIVNDTDHDLDVALSHSKSSTPGSFTDIGEGDEEVLTVEWGEYYVWVKENNSLTVSISEDSIAVTSDDTWYITGVPGAYKIRN